MSEDAATPPGPGTSSETHFILAPFLPEAARGGTREERERAGGKEEGQARARSLSASKNEKGMKSKSQES
jgi:hypothetical protein